VISAVVVAGGRSSRLGQDKRRLRLWGESGPTLLEHTLAIARSLSDDVIVVLNDAVDWPGLPARLLPDRWPEAGPLGGIATGLAAARHEWSLVLAADLPLLNLGLLRGLLDQPRQGLALVPRRAGDTRNRAGDEPLHALYHRSCLAPFERRLAQGQRQVVAALAELDVQVVDIAEGDPRLRSFTNINTPEQLREVRAALSQQPYDQEGV
jgi:molybdopterin-guanine dinucleotide biosynthesis protein A